MAFLYGVLNQSDLLSERVTAVGEDVIDTAITQSMEEHNRQMDALMALFADVTTEHKTQFLTPVAARLQPVDDSGRARPLKRAGKYDVGFPVQEGDSAMGIDFVTAQKITVKELAREVATHQDADMRWLRDHLLAALFYKSTTVPWVFTDPLKGSINVYGLANGDTVTYSIQSGADSGATDDHLKANNGVTDAIFDDIVSELDEHPENGGDKITFIPTNLKATVQALSGFYDAKDKNLAYGSGLTVLDAALGVVVPGQVIGYHDSGTWIVEWKSLPDNYSISVTTEGERPLRMRVDEEESLRGFREKGTRDNLPWFERHWMRRAGFGAWNRVGAVTYRLNSASYAIPANYSSPMI